MNNKKYNTEIKFKYRETVSDSLSKTENKIHWTIFFTVALLCLIKYEISNVYPIIIIGLLFLHSYLELYFLKNILDFIDDNDFNLLVNQDELQDRYKLYNKILNIIFFIITFLSLIFFVVTILKNY